MPERSSAGDGDNGRPGVATRDAVRSGGGPRPGPAGGDVVDVAVPVLRRMRERVERNVRLLDRLRADPLTPAPPGLTELVETARRLRHDTESLLLLAGEGAGARRGGTRQLSAVLDEAVDATEEPMRVDVRSGPGASVDPDAAAELLHVVAEVVDHVTATHPVGRIEVSARAEAPAGVVVEIRADGATRHDPDAIPGSGLAAARRMAQRSRSGIVLRTPPPAGGAVSRGPIASVHCPGSVVTVDERGYGPYPEPHRNGNGSSGRSVGSLETGLDGLGDRPFSRVLDDYGLPYGGRAGDAQPEPPPAASPGRALTPPSRRPDPLSDPLPERLPDPFPDARTGPAGERPADLRPEPRDRSADLRPDSRERFPDLRPDPAREQPTDLRTDPSGVEPPGPARHAEPPDTGAGTLRPRRRSAWDTYGRGDAREAPDPYAGPAAGPDDHAGPGPSAAPRHAPPAPAAYTPPAAPADPYRTPDPYPAPAAYTASPADPYPAPSAGSRPEPVDELFGPLVDLGPVPDEPASTPIFEAIASAWFREDGTDAGDAAPRDWESPGDDEWRAAAERAAVEEPAPLTAGGLPRRRPGGRLVPPRPAPAAAASPAAERVPDRVRERLSGYQRGLRQGRHRAEPTGSADPGDPAAW